MLKIKTLVFLFTALAGCFLGGLLQPAIAGDMRPLTIDGIASVSNPSDATEIVWILTIQPPEWLGEVRVGRARLMIPVADVSERPAEIVVEVVAAASNEPLTWSEIQESDFTKPNLRSEALIDNLQPMQGPDVTSMIVDWQGRPSDELRLLIRSSSGHRLDRVNQPELSMRTLSR